MSQAGSWLGACHCRRPCDSNPFNFCTLGKTAGEGLEVYILKSLQPPPARPAQSHKCITHCVMDIHACMLIVVVAMQEKLNTKTVNEELTNDPELLKQVDDEISKGSYY